MELMVGQRESTALLKAVCCMWTVGSPLRRHAVSIAAATAVAATAVVPISKGCAKNAMGAARFARLCWRCRLVWAW